ncbi:YrhB domain-containing protein [Pseudomonas nicosulfuronedens]
MVTYEYALKRAKEYLRDSEIPLRISHEGEFSDGWFFCFESEEYLDTGNPSAQLAGNGPFLIDKHSGELHVLGTEKPLKEYLDAYVKEKLDNLA